MEDQTGPGDMVLQLLPLVILMLPIAAGIWWISPKIPANRWLWTILSLIPGVNFVAWYLFAFILAGAVLDKLNALAGTASQTSRGTV